MLGTPSTLFVGVVPPSLLEFAHTVFRGAFASVVQKPVYTFQFERSSEPDERLVKRLQRARASNAVVLSTPTSVKSFALKFVELQLALCELADDRHQVFASSLSFAFRSMLFFHIGKSSIGSNAFAWFSHACN